MKANEEEHRGDDVMNRVTGGGHGRGVADEVAEHGCGEQCRSVCDAEGHEHYAEQARRHVLRDNVVVAEGLRHGTKEDLVEGRGGDGSVVHLGGRRRRTVDKSTRLQVSVQ